MKRFVVHDSEGKLRAFDTKQEALHFMHDDMFLVVLPKPPKVDLSATLGEALF